MAKIVRKSLKVFGLTGDTADFAKFGSQEAAAPVKTKDIELIQSLEAWDKGWADAIVDANKAPYMEDMNAAMYVIGYELGYVLQEGIPEWDDGTTYYAESIVKKTTTQELYASKTNDNVGNALPNKVDNTDWKYLVDLDDIPLDGSITAIKLATDAVETAKIKNSNVTLDKLASDSVNGNKIADDFTITQTNAGGFGLKVLRNIAEAGANALVTLFSQHASDKKAVLKIVHSNTGSCDNGALRVENQSSDRAAIEGSGVAAGVYGEGTNYDFSSPGPFTTKNGYIQAAHDALRLQIVTITADGSSPQEYGFTGITVTKVRAMKVIWWDTSISYIFSIGEGVRKAECNYDGTNIGLIYGAQIASGDTFYVAIWYIA